MSWQTCEKVVLGLSFRNQSSKTPELGHSGATTWSRTTTSSFVKWKAGKTTTGVSLLLLPPPPSSDAPAVPGTARIAATATPTSAVIVRTLPRCSVIGPPG